MTDFCCRLVAGSLPGLVDEPLDYIAHVKDFTVLHRWVFGYRLEVGSHQFPHGLYEPRYLLL